MTGQRARAEFWRLTPALLLVVYDAFGQTEEDAIYDTFASVTHGDALEYLYLDGWVQCRAAVLKKPIRRLT